MAGDVEEEKVIIAHGIGAKLVSNLEQKLLYIKCLHFFSRKKTSMLIGLNVSSLGRNCIFYRPEHNAKVHLI